MNLVIRRSRKRRTVALRVTREAVVLHAPYGVPEPELLRWVQEKRDWIEKAMAQVASRVPTERRFADGETLSYLGRTLTIRRVARRDVVLVGDTLEIPDLPTDKVRTLVAAWFRARTLEVFTPLATEMAARLGVTPTAVRVTNARARWGSCTAGGELRFNWRVLMGDPDVVTYLCAHEVAHLRELNHSPRFWRLVEQLCPDSRAAQEKLRVEGWRYSLGADGVGH